MEPTGRSDPGVSLDAGPGPIAHDIRDALLALLPHLRAYARFLARDRDLADDIVQDSVVHMLNAEGRHGPNRHFKAWAFTILRNCFYSHFRRGGHRTAPLEEGCVAQNGHQEGVLAFRDFHRAFWELPESHREVLMLIGRSGLSYEDAARVCGCQIGTIKSRLSRARRDLRQHLTDRSATHV